MADDTQDHHPDQERRVHARVRLHWELSILQNRDSARVVSTVTGNLSSQGFCCEVEEQFAAGERLQCILKVPSHTEPGASQALRCDAQVVWVRPIEAGRFGIGCRIHDYTFAVLEPAIIIRTLPTRLSL